MLPLLSLKVEYIKGSRCEVDKMESKDIGGQAELFPYTRRRTEKEQDDDSSCCN